MSPIEFLRTGMSPRAGIADQGGEIRMSAELKFKPRILGFVCNW